MNIPLNVDPFDYFHVDESNEQYCSVVAIRYPELRISLSIIDILGFNFVNASATLIWPGIHRTIFNSLDSNESFIRDIFLRSL